MRAPLLDTVGFAASNAVLDLRTLPEDTEDTLFLLTICGPARASSIDFILLQTDANDDPQGVTFPGVAPFAQVISRLPVRGPVQLSMETNGGYAYTEFEDPDVEVNLQPLVVEDVAPFTLLPTIIDTTSTTEVAVLPDQTVTLTLYVANTDDDNRVEFTYTPDDTSITPVNFVAVTGDGEPGVLNRFVKSMDRSPLVGPGVLSVTATMVSGTVTIYGYLNS